MNIIVDLILCLIIVVGAIIGFKAGFVAIAAKPVKFFATFIIAFALCGTVANGIIVPLIDEPISNYISNLLYENCADLTAENAADELPTIIKIAANLFNIDIDQTISDATNSIIETIIETFTDPIINGIAVIISFVALLIVSRIVLGILFMILKAIFDNGVLGVLNGILGCIFAGIISIAVAWGVAVILEYVFQLPAFETNEMIQNFDGGFVYNFFNTHNPLQLLLSF